jgi:hypothetical protein
VIDQPAADFSIKPTLTGEKVVLRPFIEDDLTALRVALKDPEGQVYAFNPRARHLYEKVGFIAEGVLREELRYRDQWVDAIMMSILAHEWQRHHGRP